MSSFTGVNDLTDLTNFLVEKVQQYDPTIDVSTGSAFYSSVVQPLIDRLGPDPYDTPLRDFILRRLKTEFPDLVLQDGEPLDDYAVKIMTVLLEPFRRQIRQVSNNQSLSNPELLNEKEADNLGANFFVRRKPGGYSVGIARLYYSAPRNSLITPNNVTKDGAGHRFIPVQNQLISADNMLFNIENNLYFFDVVVRAEQQGKEYNIPFNTLTAIEAAPEVVKISNKAAFEEGDDKESTIDFVARVEESLTEKSLVTFRGIRARLTDVFESVRIIQTIGFGDPEMKRDIMTGSGETAPYAYFIGSAVASQRYVTLNTGALIPFLTEAGISYVSFTDGGVKVGLRRIERSGRRRSDSGPAGRGDHVSYKAAPVGRHPRQLHSQAVHVASWDRDPHDLRHPRWYSPAHHPGRYHRNPQQRGAYRRNARRVHSSQQPAAERHHARRDPRREALAVWY
jgi:hypothetical protein